MLAELVDHVIGVDPAKHVFMAVVVDARTKGELAWREFRCTAGGYRAALEWADEIGTCADERVWSIEGAGSYGSGLAQTLAREHEWVLEFDHPQQGSAPDGAKTDRLDAARAAREALGRQQWAEPRARGPREGLRTLMVARNGAQHGRTAAINQLKALVLTAPVTMRDDLAGLSRTALIRRCGRFRVAAHTPPELAGTKTAMRSLAQRITALGAEADELESFIKAAVTEIAPQLLNEFGIGPICAGQIIISWSHPGRCRNANAFCRLAGVAPIEATTGGADITRHRLNRGGDRQLNRALHTIALTRIARDPTTQAYMAQRRADGKTTREARRCIKRYIARRVYRLLENPPR